MSGRDIYDVSPTERKILEERQKRRTVLREEYLMQRLNPYRQAVGDGGHIPDPALTRWINIRTTAYSRTKPTFSNAAFFFGITFGPMLIVGTYIYKSRAHTEHLRRTGQVPYLDRTDKFC